MRQRFPALAAAAAAAALAAVADPGPAFAQTDGQGAWELPRTPWGDPDLRGMWPIGHLIGTPFQRPEEFGPRAELTDEELSERGERVEARNTRYEDEQDSNKVGIGHWADATAVTRMTSLLVDPPNGRFPEMTEYGKRQSELMGSSWSREVDDGVDDFDTRGRCITRGMPASMLPFDYNNGIRIVQAPGYVVIDLEMIHEARIIPVDGRPPLGDEIRQWMGESRGDWEGNRLIVETTNFNGKTGMTNVGIPGSPRHDTPTTTDMRSVETFERVADDTILYTITVEDPQVLTSSWTARYPMRRDPDYRFFEYACHEDNTASADAAALANKGAVVVTMNYRLGPFGFLAHPALSEHSAHGASGNYGLMDMIASAAWVGRKVAALGRLPSLARMSLFDKRYSRQLEAK